MFGFKEIKIDGQNIPPVPSDSWNEIQVEHAPHFEQPPSPLPQAQFLQLNENVRKIM